MSYFHTIKRNLEFIFENTRTLISALVWNTLANVFSFVSFSDCLFDAGMSDEDWTKLMMMIFTENVSAIPPIVSKPTFYTLNEMHKNISMVQRKRLVLWKNRESINWTYVLLPCLPSLHQSKVDMKREERERERERER